MENKTTHLKWHTLNDLKEKKQWTEAIAIAHEIEALLFKQSDENAIVHLYLILSDLYFEQLDFTNGLKYLTLSESVVLQLGNWKQFVMYTDIIIRHHLLHFNSNELIQFIDQVIPIAFENEQYEILSHCFIIQSYLHLTQKEVRLAIQEAKMAYFYAKLIEQIETNDFSETAKLLLVLALIEQTALTEATYYIEEFNWQSQKAKDYPDQIMLECIHSMVLLLNHQFADGLVSYKDMFNSFLHSKKFMYNSLLFEQMQSVLKKVEHLIEAEELKEIHHLIVQLQEKYNTFNLQHNETFILPDLQALDSVNVVNFELYKVGEHLFKQAVDEYLHFMCLLLETNLKDLNTQEVELFTQQLQTMSPTRTKFNHFVSQFSPTLLVCIILSPEEINQAAIEKFKYMFAHHPPVTYEKIHTSHLLFKDFKHLFHYTLLNKHLKLNFELERLNPGS